MSIWQALANKLGREPTHREACDEVRRILSEVTIELATQGKLTHQRKVQSCMSTREFEHYHGCRMRDPDNCSGCALITGGENGPNYAAWPLVYIENHRTIPAKWRKAFERELQSDNKPYADNIRAQIAKHGVRFSDAGPCTSASQQTYEVSK